MAIQTYRDLIAVKLTYLERQKVKTAWDMAQETGRLLNGLIRSLAPDSIREEQEAYTTDLP